MSCRQPLGAADRARAAPLNPKSRLGVVTGQRLRNALPEQMDSFPPLPIPSPAPLSRGVGVGGRVGGIRAGRGGLGRGGREFERRREEERGYGLGLGVCRRSRGESESAGCWPRVAGQTMCPHHGGELAHRRGPARRVTAKVGAQALRARKSSPPRGRTPVTALMVVRTRDWPW